MNLFIVWLAIFVQVESSVFHNAKEFRFPKTQDGKRFTQSFHLVEEERFIHFDYEAEIVEERIVILDDHSIQKVVCNENDVQITLSDFTSSDLDDKLQEASFITGGSQWKCLNPNTNLPSPLLRRIVNVKFGENLIIISTVEASYTEVFKNVNLKFSTNKFQEDHFKHVIFDGPVGVSGMSKRSLWDFFSNVADDVKSFVNVVSNIVSDVGEVANFLGTGNFAEQEVLAQKQISWNFNNETNSAYNSTIQFGEGVQCTNCFANIDAQLDFNILISDYQINNITLVFIGTADLNVEGTIKVYESFQQQDKFYLGSVNLDPALEFWVAGIPLLLFLDVPISGGYVLDVNVTAELTANIQASGKIEYGFQYDGSNLTWIKENYWQHAGGITNVNEEVVASAMIYLLPTPILSVDKIGGIQLGLKPFLEIILTYENEENCQLQVALNYGLQTTLGGFIHIGIGEYNWVNKTFGPVPIYSMRRPINSGCISFDQNGNNFNISSNSNLQVAGQTWYGNQIAHCISFPDGEAAMQYVGNDENLLLFVLLETFQMIQYELTGVCVVQTIYGGYVEGESISLTPLQNQQGQTYLYYACTYGSEVDWFSVPLYGSFTENYSEFNLMSSDKCCELQMFLAEDK